METTTLNKVKHITLKTYTGFNTLESEFAIEATIDQVERLCEKLGVAFNTTYALFSFRGECFLVISYNRSSGLWKIGNTQIDGSLLKQLLSEIFNYQLDQ